MSPVEEAIERDLDRQDAQGWVRRFFRHGQPAGYNLARQITRELLNWAGRDRDRREVARLVIAEVSPHVPALKEILQTFVVERR